MAFSNHIFTSSSQEKGPCFSLCPSMLSSLLLPLPLSPALISEQTHKEGERGSRGGGACWGRWDMGRAEARRPSSHPLRGQAQHSRPAGAICWKGGDCGQTGAS